MKELKEGISPVFIAGNKLKQINQRCLPLNYKSHVIEKRGLELGNIDNQKHPIWLSCITAFQIILSRYTHQLLCPIHVNLNTSDFQKSDLLLIEEYQTATEIQSMLRQNLRSLQQAQPVKPTCDINASDLLINDVQQLNSIEIHDFSSTQKLEFSRTLAKDRHISTQINSDSLKLEVRISKEILELSWVFNSNKFSPDFIQNFSNAYVNVLKEVCRSPEQTLADINIVDEKLTSQLLALNETSIDQNKLVPLHFLFAQQLSESADDVAIVYQQEDIKTVLTYRELEEQSNQLAHYLLAQNIYPGTRIGVHLDYQPEVLIAILAISKLYAQYVPMDPEYPKERLTFMLEDSGIGCLITMQAFSSIADTISTNQKARLLVLELDDASINEGIANQPKDLPEPGANKNDVAYVIYTSGTTGRPKGVLGSHSGLSNRLQWMKKQFPARDNTRFATSTSISFVDHIAEVLQPLTVGGTIYMLPKAVVSNTEQYLEAIKKHQIQRLTIIPSLLSNLLHSQNSAALNSLELVITSGEPLFQNITDAFHLHFNGTARLVNLYGMTEAGADVSWYEVEYPQHLSVMQYFNNSAAIFPNSESGDLSKQNVSEFDDYITEPDVSLEELADKFKETSIPSNPTSLNRYLQHLQKDVFPYLINVASEKYIGHMTSALPNFMPEFSRFITQANQNVVKIETSKALTFMERQLMAMLHKLFFAKDDDYYADKVQNPHNMFGIVTSGGSLANITALYVARNKSLLQQGITKEQLQQQGAIGCMQSLGYKRAVILVSRLAHYSIRKTVGLLGLGENNLITIEQDENQRIDTDALEQTIEHCRKNNDFIIAVIGIAGATETGTVDPLPQMADIARQYNIHFHADAAWGGAFMFSDEYKYKLAGIEHADTITFCAHKQLYLAQGISLCVLKDPKSLFAVTTHADYQASAGSFDLGQFTLEGSRPAASLMLHAALHLFSQSGYGWMIEQSMRKAAFLKELIEGSDCFELVGDNDLNIINYRYVPISLRNKATYTEAEHKQMSTTTEQIQEIQFLQGRTFVSKTRILHSLFSKEKIGVFRVVPINPLTSFDDLIEVLNDQLEIASKHIETGGPRQSMSLKNSLFSAVQPTRPAVPIGNSIANTKVYILDANLKLLPPGAIGEIFVAGSAVSKGYLNLPELTKKQFITNPYSQNSSYATLYRTGDLGRFNSDNQIEFCGRVDHQIKLHGNRIELDEIELILSEFPEVNLARIAIVHDNTNQDIEAAEEKMVAFVESASATSKSLKNALTIRLFNELQQHLPADHIPNNIWIMKSIPRLPNGKVDLHQCKLSFHQRSRLYQEI